jgi:hypothetical protein
MIFSKSGVQIVRTSVIILGIISLLKYLAVF